MYKPQFFYIYTSKIPIPQWCGKWKSDQNPYSGPDHHYNLKKRMVKAFVWSVVLYGSETWTLQKEDIRRLEAFEIWIWRQMMRVTRTEHKTK